MPYTLIPGNDPTLATRIRRQLMALMSYAMFSVPLLYAVANGWIGFGYRGLALFLATGLAVNAVFIVAIRSGLTRRLADPSMMMLQVAVAGVLGHERRAPPIADHNGRFPAR